MTKETKARQKPDKPRKDFPLGAANNGQWQKKIRGKTHYFGTWNDPNAAEREYLRQLPYLQAGQTPPPKDDVRTTIQVLCNQFMESKKARMERGELSVRMYHGYYRICEKLIDFFGRGKIVAELTPSDFERLRNRFAATGGLVSLGNRIQHARIVFRYASEMDLIDKPLKFGPEFKRPRKLDLRKEAKKKPEKLFKSADLRKIITGARPQLKAMILMGINCGFGQTDISKLPLSALDLKNGWVSFPRPKTEIERNCPLWPETVSALKWVIDNRREPVQPFADRVFINKLGLEYVRVTVKGDNSEKGTNIDGVTLEFNKLLAKLKLSGEGRTFYALRHTFETIGGDSRDQIAVDSIMGHSPDSDDMAAVYRKAVFNRRLIAVTDHVRAWLFPASKGKLVAK